MLCIYRKIGCYWVSPHRGFGPALWHHDPSDPFSCAFERPAMVPFSSCVLATVKRRSSRYVRLRFRTAVGSRVHLVLISRRRDDPLNCSYGLITAKRRSSRSFLLRFRMAVHGRVELLLGLSSQMIFLHLQSRFKIIQNQRNNWPSGC